MFSIIILPLISIIFIALIGVLVYFIHIQNKKIIAAFQAEYQSFLKKHEGEEFFCYTNRKKVDYILERELLPKIERPIHIVKLVGRKPKTHLEQQFVGHALYNIKHKGFPVVMKIVNGEMIDYSLHHQIYEAINKNKLMELENIVSNGLLVLRQQTDQMAA